MRALISFLIAAALVAPAAAANPHVIAFGKPLPVKMFIGPDQQKSIDMKIRSLYVDGKIREFTIGDPHDVTDRIFVVRRAYRVNDWLPEDEGTNHKWKWQRGGWLMVDRETGRVSQLTLPEFDPFFSVATWYRDYVAYCGANDDMTHLYAVVMQLGNKKPVLHRDLGAPANSAIPDSECAPPEWQRGPVRVTFAPDSGQKTTFAIRGHVAGVAAESGEGDEKQ
ncbi:MAG: hypothetical protein ACRD3E_11545 [Terriglobales bacterium]